MKKKYESPVMTIQDFETTDYVATCFGVITPNAYKKQWFSVANPTDGVGYSQRYELNKHTGFEDDGLDKLQPGADKCTDGSFQHWTWYGYGPTLQSRYGVKTDHLTKYKVEPYWEGTQTGSGKWKQNSYYPVYKLIEITDKNCNQYGCSANAS